MDNWLPKTHKGKDTIKSGQLNVLCFRLSLWSISLSISVQFIENLRKIKLDINEIKVSPSGWTSRIAQIKMWVLMMMGVNFISISYAYTGSIKLQVPLDWYSSPHTFWKRPIDEVQEVVIKFFLFHFFFNYCGSLFENFESDSTNWNCINIYFFVRSELFVQTCCWKICHLPRGDN